MDEKKNFFLWDLLFCVLAGGFSYFALAGSLDLTPGGALMDSDLQNYTQLLVGLKHPEFFSKDPIVALFPYDPGLPNLLALLTYLPWFAEEPWQALLEAGALAIFLHLLGYYVLGRWLFREPRFAALTSLCFAITIYWAYGTFWGIFLSDPVPRYLFAAVWPLLLILAAQAQGSFPRQALVLFLTGCCMIIHTVSTLMVGPMFFVAFALENRNLRYQEQAKRFFGNAAALMVPIASYLWLRLHDLLTSSYDAALFQTVRELRFGEDYSHIFSSLLSVCVTYSWAPPLLPLGFFAAWFLYKRRLSLPIPLQKILRLWPGLLLGICVMVLVCACEITLMGWLNRQNMSQEILRGTRFLLPLLWIPLVGVIYLILQKRTLGKQRVVLLLFVLCLLLFVPEKQVLAFRHGLSSATGLSFLDSAKGAERSYKSHALYDALCALKKEQRDHDVVYAHEDLMAVRYFAHANLHPQHKDGNVIYYARNAELAKKWVEEQSLLKQNPNAWCELWKKSSATLLLTSKKALRKSEAQIDRRGEESKLIWKGNNGVQTEEDTVLFANDDWVLVRKEQKGAR